MGFFFCVIYGFLSYGYHDGVSPREGDAFLREEELLVVGVGLADVVDAVEVPLALSLLFLMETRKLELKFDFRRNNFAKSFILILLSAAWIRTCSDWPIG